MNRILVTGASGLLGSNLVQIFNRQFEVVAAYCQHPLAGYKGQVIQLDITNARDVQASIRRQKPQAVIHCAAETNVDYCEAHPDHAYRTNVAGTENLAKASAEVGAKFLYISTDSVFDGQSGRYSETAPSQPLNVYAYTKLAGEQAVQAYLNNALIIRTNIYGWSAGRKFSLAEWVLDRLEKRQVVPGFVDIYFSPVLVNDLALMLIEMMKAKLEGVYHVGASDFLSKYEFAREICKIFNKELRLVQPVSSDDANFKAKRPKNTSLDVGKITEALSQPMPSVVEGLHRFKELLEDGYVSCLRGLVNDSTL